MNVLYDYQIFVAQKFGGISRYFVDLINGLEREEGITPYLEVVGNKNYYLPNNRSTQFNLLERLKKYNKREHKVIRKNQNIVLDYLGKNIIDVFHPTYYDPYFINHIKKPLVITVHDMIYENFPDFFPSNEPTAYYKRLHIEKADRIIAVSNQTKIDILKHYDLDESKIAVVHHGIDLTIPSVYEDISDLPKDYILYVGGRYGYKNFQLLVQAFSILISKYDNVKLVVAGASLGIAEKELLLRNNLQEKVFIYSASNEQLNTLYKKALFFVYPSIYEGFGLPILEAYKNDCAVLLSNASCFPEIAGEGAAYFEPFSVDSLTEKMKILLDDIEYRDGLIKKGREKLLDYPMKNCIGNTIKVYKSLI